MFFFSFQFLIVLLRKFENKIFCGENSFTRGWSWLVGFCCSSTHSGRCNGNCAANWNRWSDAVDVELRGLFQEVAFCECSKYNKLVLDRIQMFQLTKNAVVITNCGKYRNQLQDNHANYLQKIIMFTALIFDEQDVLSISLKFTFVSKFV